MKALNLSLVDRTISLIPVSNLPATMVATEIGGLTPAGATTPSLLALYDPITDTEMRQALIGVYSRLADKAATDKLVWIARNEQNATLKRRAISALSRNSDPVIRQALQDIVER